MDNYISTVLSKIKDGKTKSDIQAELEDHYNERVEYYTRIGYDRETAEEKANAHFGEDAEIVGEQIDKINGKSYKITILFTVINVLFLPVYWAALFIGNSDSVILSTAFQLLFFIELLVALRKKSVFLVCINLAFFVFYVIRFEVLTLPSMLIFKAFKGEAGSFIGLIRHQHWLFINDKYAVCAEIIFAICIVLSIFTAILCVRFRKSKYRKRNIKQEKALKLSLIILSFFACAVIAFAAFYPSEEYVGEWKSLQGVYVVESDEKIDPREINEYTYIQNYLELYWYGEEAISAYNTFVDYSLQIDETEERFDEDSMIYESNYTLQGKFQSTKKYVCVIPVYDFLDSAEPIPVFDDCVWVDASKGCVFESEWCSTNAKYEIEILPKEETLVTDYGK